MALNDLPSRRPVVAVVLPAYNAERTLERTVRAIPEGSADRIILVDDASTDNTVPLARSLGLTVAVHDKNSGYGANQKTCYRLALDAGADIVVMLHPDYQYDPRLVPFMTGFIREGICDIMLANRIRTRREALSGGMPGYKYFFNRMLTFMENLTLGLNLGEYHTGYRAFSRASLETIRWDEDSDDFVFDQQMLVQAALLGLRIGEVPVPARYFPEASSINFVRSARYGIETLGELVLAVIHRLGITRISRFLPRSPAR